MIKIIPTITLILCLSFVEIYAENTNPDEKKITYITLNHISGDEVVSVLNSLIDKSVSISQKENTLIIYGTMDKTKNILPIIERIDTPAENFTIEFIASNRKIDFETTSRTYETNKKLTNSTQSMSIVERQWINLNTGLSVPTSLRKKLPDGTEVQSFSYEKIRKSYLIKVHEFSGWSVIQVGVNADLQSEDISNAIKHTRLDTTIIGKTGEWIEISKQKNNLRENKDKIYSTNNNSNYHIYLYIKVNKNNFQTESINIIK